MQCSTPYFSNTQKVETQLLNNEPYEELPARKIKFSEELLLRSSMLLYYKQPPSKFQKKEILDAQMAPKIGQVGLSKINF